MSKPGIPRFGPVWSRAASSELLSAFWSTVIGLAGILLVLAPAGCFFDEIVRFVAIGSKVGIPTLSKSWRKKAIVSFPARPDWGRQMLQKNGQHSVPQSPLWRGTVGYPAQAQRPGGGGKASEPPHSLEDSPGTGPARSFTGGWWLLMTHQLSLEQSGTSSASLDHRAETQSLPPQARILGPEPSWCAH